MDSDKCRGCRVSSCPLKNIVMNQVNFTTKLNFFIYFSIALSRTAKDQRWLQHHRLLPPRVHRQHLHQLHLHQSPSQLDWEFWDSLDPSALHTLSTVPTVTGSLRGKGLLSSSVIAVIRLLFLNGKWHTVLFFLKEMTQIQFISSSLVYQCQAG